MLILNSIITFVSNSDPKWLFGFLGFIIGVIQTFVFGYLKNKREIKLAYRDARLKAITEYKAFLYNILANDPNMTTIILFKAKNTNTTLFFNKNVDGYIENTIVKAVELTTVINQLNGLGPPNYQMSPARTTLLNKADTLRKDIYSIILGVDDYFRKYI
jgi:hypothetical protein